MRLPLVLASALVAALAVALPAQAQRAPGTDARSLELQDAEGNLVVSLQRGLVLGQLDEGRITITLRRAPQSARVVVSGAETTTQTNIRTTVYEGDDLRFKIPGGSRIAVQGEGLDIGVVGRGLVTFRGEGRVSLDGDDFEDWPAAGRVVVLGG